MDIRELVAQKICCLYPRDCEDCKKGKGCPDEWDEIKEQVDATLQVIKEQGYRLVTEEMLLTDEEIIANRERLLNTSTNVLPVGVTKLERLAAKAQLEKVLK